MLIKKHVLNIKCAKADESLFKNNQVKQWTIFADPQVINNDSYMPGPQDQGVEAYNIASFASSKFIWW